MEKKLRKSLGEQLFDELCRDIVQGRLPPGSNLPPERKLAEQRGLNRGAVREAMKRLAQMRLIHIVHGGGNRVADWQDAAGLELLAELLVTDAGLPDFAMLRSLLEMRACLGVDAARKAAERATPEAVQGLQQCVDAMRRRPLDIEYLQGESQHFWARLVRAADNQAYVMSFNSLARGWERYGAHLRHLLSDELRAISQYQAIVDACRKRDPDRAAKHAQQLVQLASEQMGKAELNYQQRQAVNNGDLFAC